MAREGWRQPIPSCLTREYVNEEARGEPARLKQLTGSPSQYSS